MPTPTYFKNMPALTGVALAPQKPLSVAASATAAKKALSSVYNRLGGLMGALSGMTGVEVPAILSVFYVESGGQALTPGRAIIRFECNLFYSAWGSKNATAYGQCFKHGGCNGTPGKPWENHQFCPDPAQGFGPLHRNQESEYAALAVASRLGGEEMALPCISIGGCQILVSNYKMIGYASPMEMWSAFQNSEAAHVLGFFDFCAQQPAPKRGDLIKCLQAKRWTDFARYYNGPGNAVVYGGRIESNYKAASSLVL